MNKCITVTTPTQKAKSYPILISIGLLSNPSQWLLEYDHIVIITDHSVKRRYGNQLAATLKNAQKNVLLLSFPTGEKSKSIKTKQYLEEQMLQNNYNRDTVIIALGGGVVGDIAGFVAATYMRGIPWIQIPTTLLAMVDSSVGGKTGIDTPQGKNLIGAYWQPKLVLTDINCLTTLPKKQLINGVIEAFKMFLTSDQKSFHYAHKHINSILFLDKKILANIIQRAVAIKANVVQEDEKDNNLRMILNFGHTIGHALEHISHYKIMHGHAVGYGVLLEAKIAEILGLLAPKHFILIENTFSQLGIYTKQLKKYKIDELINATKMDKKVLNKQTRYVLLTQIGDVHKASQLVAHPVADNIVKQAYLDLTE